MTQFLDTRIVDTVADQPLHGIELRSNTYGVIGWIVSDGADGYNLILEEGIARDIGQRIFGETVNISHKAAEYMALAVVEQLAHEGY